jgi:hypothetical protein
LRVQALEGAPHRIKNSVGGSIESLASKCRTGHATCLGDNL